jgi:hypothetical protein
MAVLADELFFPDQAVNEQPEALLRRADWEGASADRS